MTFQSDTQQAETVSSQETAEIAASKMDPEFKAKWVEALRSAKYGQAICTLREDGEDNFCCLGVALDIQGAKWSGSIAILGERRVGSLDTPPSDLIGGLSGDRLNDLIAMNDGTDGKRKHSFAEIADFIEQNL